MNKYIALFEQARGESGFSVTFPDFPGCISAGDDFNDAFRMAHEALSLHVSGMLEDEDDIPKPRSLEEIRETWEDWKIWEKDGNFLVTNIALLPPKSKSTRFSVTMDEELLGEIDAVTKNRSAFLASAAKKVLKGYANKTR